MRIGHMHIPYDVLRNGNMDLPFPLMIDLQLTYSCNLHCEMCGQWGKEGIFRNKIGELKKQELTTDQWLSIIEEAGKHRLKSADGNYIKPHIHLWGGEPLLSKSFRAIAEAAGRQDLTLSMVTNGTLLEKNADVIMNSPFDSISISIDGDEASHDLIRGMPGTFAAVMRGIKALQQARLESKNRFLSIGVISVLQKHNEDKITAIINIMSAAGIDFLLLAPLMFITPEQHRLQQRVMKEHFGLVWTCSSGWEVMQMGTKTKKLETLLKKLPRRHKNMKIMTNLPVPADLKRWFDEPANTFGRTRCLVPWRKINVMPNGDCNFCVDFPDYKLGNVKEKKLMEIWNGVNAGRFRARMKKAGVFPICSRCLWLYNDFVTR